MSLLKTEYQLHFGGDKDGVEKENYLSRLNFRKDRMSNEKRHTPLFWADADEKVDEKKIIAESISSTNTYDVDTSVIESSNESSNSENVSEDINNKEAELKNEEANTDIILTRDIGTQSPSKVRIVKQNKGVLKPVNRKKQIEHDQPIIAYGWADNSSLQAKKTFNIKAPKTEVRTSALRAANQRDVQRKKRLTGKEKLRREKLKQQEVIDALTNFNQWETEYRRQFSVK